MMRVAVGAELDTAIVNLEAWLETMRCRGGYGGPVVHWWQQCFVYTGQSLDWRYEGIIAGYLQLWERTKDEQWLRKACRAGDDLVAGQLQNGHFAASAFEINPATAGTPHEASCDIGLLLLALTLRERGCIEWYTYATCARRNLQAFYIDELWDEESKSFHDSPALPSFVPNKAATACEGFFLLAELEGDERWIEQYVLPTLNRIVEHQIAAEARLRGAIAQNSIGSRRVEKYFPLYIARCVPALLRGYSWTGNACYLESAVDAMQFIERWSEEDGTIPTVIYPNLEVNRYPTWIASLADILRVAELIRSYGIDVELQGMHERLLGGQDESGGIQTAVGFEGQAGRKRSSRLDVRDVLHVAGWCDKAFRYLSSRAGSVLPPGSISTFEVECVFQGKVMHLVETPEQLEIRAGRQVVYRWRKGEPWAEKAEKEFWLR